MPVYEYACKSCGQHTEARQSVDDPPLTECPNCGGPLRKVFGSIGISFKGSGFYRNDSRRSGGASKAKDESKADSAKSEKSDKGGAGEKASTSDKSTTSKSDTKSGSNGSSSPAPAKPATPSN